MSFHFSGSPRLPTKARNDQQELAMTSKNSHWPARTRNDQQELAL